MPAFLSVMTGNMGNFLLVLMWNFSVLIMSCHPPMGRSSGKVAWPVMLSFLTG